ncbi:MAG: 1,4-alpha-glucan-branching enzyme, partial [Deltaproteobacteria bacterium]|nr:1,4-alpha-glucan-branching enzyme [Deltaproteobacteria bacterium]
TLANKLAHTISPEVITIAEDVSGMPGLACPIEQGGFGFDYRLAMGIPDFWVKNLRFNQDEDWHVEGMFYELTNRRSEEKTISYAESHDQALVGDQTIIFRLLQSHMYNHMRIEDQDMVIDRGLALHRLIRFATLSTASHGYLNFMGNEFGHPEWIDFPREGNNWSYHYARRLWSLRDNPELQYHRLADFDVAMLTLAKDYKILQRNGAQRLYSHVSDQVLAFSRAGLIFVFNLNPCRSFTDYRIPAPPGKYRLIFDTDQTAFGGNGRLQQNYTYRATPIRENEYVKFYLRLYLPTRTALVLLPVDF